MCEMKKCKCCGRELPVTDFRKTRLGLMSTCNECLRKKQMEGRERKKQADNYSADIDKARMARISDFTPRELMARLKELGYDGKLTYTVTKEIDLKNL